MKMSDMDPAAAAKVKALNVTFMTVVEQSMARLSVEHDNTPCLLLSDDLPANCAVLICGSGTYLALCSLHEKVRELHAESVTAQAISKAATGLPPTT
jgi:hypothetical protein